MKMPMDMYQERRTGLLTTFGTEEGHARHKRVQGFAILYAESGWTQEELAEVEHMSVSRINQLLIFGRFLISTNCGKEITLPEGRFRAFWKRTNKAQTDNARFAAVAQMLDDESQKGKPEKTVSRQLGKIIVATFADGKWRRLPEIAAELEQDQHVVKDILDRIVTQGLYKTFAERRPGAKGTVSYRLVKGGGKKINLAAFYAECKPVLDEMEKTINGHHVDFSQTAMKMAFAQFRQVIERLAR